VVKKEVQKTFMENFENQQTSQRMVEALSMKTAAALVAWFTTLSIVLSIALFNQTNALEEQTARADLLYCQTIYMSLDNMTTEATTNRIKLENTYFKNNCDEVLKGE